MARLFESSMNWWMVYDSNSNLCLSAHGQWVIFSSTSFASFVMFSELDECREYMDRIFSSFRSRKIEARRMDDIPDHTIFEMMNS
jgi:hypothetical protein